MLFVGLGGTGCHVGVELEKRLRQALCGPDGTRLVPEIPGSLPYQLPSCLQFVYADLSANDLQRVLRNAVPGPEHDLAARKTMHLITDLVPARLMDSADVAQSLRINADGETIGWLPPKEGDPRVGPLDHGAGQLPMAARGVLFETLRRNPETALLAIREALTSIVESAGDLYVASGGQTQRIDRLIVFVAFSVAGGTGAGLYYDYLHLISHLMRQGQIEAEIYPLIVLPSAFDGAGGGRAADLNAGSALVDLFRLIDDQNAPGARDMLDLRGTHGTISVRYPGLDEVQLAPNTLQTAFLFGRQTVGVHRYDLFRSMVSLITALIGNDGLHRSITRGFINSKVDRQAIADTGVGRRGVTTAAVAELTTPPEVVDIVSTHLLANAVSELLVPAAQETNRPYVRHFIAASGLDPLLNAHPLPIPPVGNPAGGAAIRTALMARADEMNAALEQLRAALTISVANLAQGFDPATAAAALLGGLDPFRLHRTIFGHTSLSYPSDRGGFSALLEEWRSPPVPPHGIDTSVPLPTGLPKTRRLRLSDGPVLTLMNTQGKWYDWQARLVWNEAWNDCHRLWSRPWQAFIEEFRAIHEQFLIHARNDPQQFQARAGITYLLPVADDGIEGVYQNVLAGLKQNHSEHLPSDAHDGHLLNLILGPDGWASAFAAGQRDPGAALASILRRIRDTVSEQIHPGGRTSLLANLLAGAAKRQDDDDPYRFREKVAGLLVDGALVPDGQAPLKVLVSYPAAQENQDIERFLSRTLSLPAGTIGDPDFRAVHTDSITVALIRSSMGITEVPELRRVVKRWAEAHRHPRPQDTLPWRRRLTPDTGYVLMTEADRVRVLHRLLCAAWNGTIDTGGDPASPDHIVAGTGPRKSGRMKLGLVPLGALSSWASVLQAYEDWILDDDSPAKPRLAARLMSFTAPTRSSPAAEFHTLVNLAVAEPLKIADPERNRLLSGDPQLAVFREFWSHDLPAALHQPIGATGSSLFDLYDRVRTSPEPGQNIPLDDPDSGPLSTEPPMPKESPKVFLSYAREDAAQADKLYHSLVDQGVSVWKDDHDLLPGEGWEHRIRRIFPECEFAILCLSQTAVTKRGFFQVELKLAARVQQERPLSDIYMIPAKLDAQLRLQDLPPEIAALHIVDLAADWEGGVQKIVTAMRHYRRSAAAET
jgi:hypothetical protein